MVKRLRVRILLEAVIGGAAAGLAVLTLFFPDWIEEIVRVDPDGHNGFVEWLVVGALLVVAVSLGAFARADWRRLVAIRSQAIDPTA
jgi:hypothetical protein